MDGCWVVEEKIMGGENYLPTPPLVLPNRVYSVVLDNTRMYTNLMEGHWIF